MLRSGDAFPVSGILLVLAVFELGIVGLCLAGGSASRRRSHFWLRVLLAGLAIPIVTTALAGVAGLGVLPDGVAVVVLPLLLLLSVFGLMFVPALLYRSGGSSSGPDDSAGGGGAGPVQPPPPPGGGGGGIPLPDADQPAMRRRDHSRRSFDAVRPRRPAHEPERRPAPTRP